MERLNSKKAGHQPGKGGFLNEKEMKAVFEENGCGDFKFMDPAEMVTGQWVRMKCRFGCNEYGKGMMCPPNLPSVTECREFLGEYSKAVIFHFSATFEDPEARHEWSRSINRKLSKIEREVFLSGFYKAFMLFIDPCNFCVECSGPEGECRETLSARPSGEGLGMDVYATARKTGYEINVVKDYDGTMNRFGFLLIE
jgi:predicted metal-binding protein